MTALLSQAAEQISAIPREAPLTAFLKDCSVDQDVMHADLDMVSHADKFRMARSC